MKPTNTTGYKGMIICTYANTAMKLCDEKNVFFNVTTCKNMESVKIKAATPQKVKGHT